MKTLYEKRGRRYHPVLEENPWDHWPEGTHIVIVTPGVKATRYKIEPNFWVLAATAYAKESAIVKAVADKLAMRPVNRSLTPEQKLSWDAFVKAMGNDRFIVEYPSVQEIANDIMKILTEGI